MAAINITDKDFQEKVFNSEVPVLVDFWAPWCGPCKMAEPVLEELSDQYKDKVVIAKINVDENQEYAKKFGILSIPTTILFKKDAEIGRQTGFSRKQAYDDLIKKGL